MPSRCLISSPLWLSSTTATAITLFAIITYISTATGLKTPYIIAVIFSLLFFALATSLIPHFINTRLNNQKPAPLTILQNSLKIFITQISALIGPFLPFFICVIIFFFYASNFNNEFLAIILFIPLTFLLALINFLKWRYAAALSAQENTPLQTSLKNSAALTKGKYAQNFFYIGFFLFLTCSSLIILYILSEAFSSHPLLFHLAAILPLYYALLLTTIFSTATHHHRHQKTQNQETILKVFD